MVLDSEPAFLDDLVVPLREILTILLMVAVVVRLGQRVQAATPLMRRTLTPVLAVAILRVGTFGFSIGARRLDASEPVIETLIWVILLGLPTNHIKRQ